MAEFSWWPSWKEGILYIIVMTLVVILIRLFHHNQVQRIVNKTSRCIREQKVGYRSGVYSVSAFNRKNLPMYTVTYDTASKTTDVKCSCKPGTVTNSFEKIKYFNMRDPGTNTNIYPEKLCQCDSSIDTSNTYYSGYPGLIRYMYSDDRTFFDNALDPNYQHQ